MRNWTNFLLDNKLVDLVEHQFLDGKSIVMPKHFKDYAALERSNNYLCKEKG